MALLRACLRACLHSALAAQCIEDYLMHYLAMKEPQ